MVTHNVVRLEQEPAPGTHCVACQGDVMEFKLLTGSEQRGSASLRTNMGNGATRLREIVENVEDDHPILDRAWHDIPMHKVSETEFSISIPLTEVGRFEAKTCLIVDGMDRPIWPEGANVIIKVEPAEYACANSIYAAFVRQFGPNKFRPSIPADRELLLRELESEHYSVIPRSGTFRDLINELDFIIDELRFRILLLLPIHPIPTTYARMGRFGSPFAVMDFMDVNPALAEFDHRTTPMDQFLELVDAVHKRFARIFIDIPINHTGWASHLQITRPEWFTRGEDRSFQSPGAWGVTWEDLAKLDYSNRGLWMYMADVFLFWCRRGVDGFRCDAGYMIPEPVWRYIVAKVRLEYPETVFLLEGLGGDPMQVDRLLDTANLDWAYSELFQNYDRPQVESYLRHAADASTRGGALVHFAETHDNNRLASVSREYARMRTTLAAMASHHGCFGITNGVEWFADESIDVHDAASLNWGSRENLIEPIRRLNTILRSHPAFGFGSLLRLIHRGPETAVAVLRTSADRADNLLVAVNLDSQRESVVEWEAVDFPCEANDAHDLLSGTRVHILRQGNRLTCKLPPAAAFCLSINAGDVREIESALMRAPEHAAMPGEQLLRAKAMEVSVFFQDLDGGPAAGYRADARALENNPQQYCIDCAMEEDSDAPPFGRVVRWQWPSDIRRTVMLPPGHVLHVMASVPFVADLRFGERTLRRQFSLRNARGSYFALFVPATYGDVRGTASLVITTYPDEGSRTETGKLLFLPSRSGLRVRTSFTRAEVEKRSGYALCTNGLGGMAQVRGHWGEINSQYDAMLAGNLHPEYPVDRHVMLTRCRTWLLCNGYSREVSFDCQQRFSQTGDGSVTWRFSVPAYEGRLVDLTIAMKMKEKRNALLLRFSRGSAGTGNAHLDDDVPVALIVRPDIEDRSSHAKTIAHSGPESQWPDCVRERETGFSFSPVSERRLVMDSNGSFTSEPAWTYGIEHPFELDRGLGGRSDLFSPGYFRFSLKGGQSGLLTADIQTAGEEGDAGLFLAGIETSEEERLTFQGALRSAMDKFVVERKGLHTVIAGYPWFLDWGRDALICLRGMIAANRRDEVRKIIAQFATYESQGTLPNAIHGHDKSNRDTSDAPLWLFVACRDMLESGSDAGILETACGERSLREVLLSIADHYMKGTPNGIRMDDDSGLIFSPAHFTWMDTNHPAGTPREGYPIEIQALWYAALKFLSEIEPGGIWSELARTVQDSVLRFYPRTPSVNAWQSAFLSDCLHGSPGKSAAEAVADDHLRPNQLLAVTLGLLGNPTLSASVLSACEELLVPGAIRSLADRPVDYRAPIEKDGRILNDPSRPYWGEYRGDEDTRRKPAYHNGTAWTWLFPSFPEALYMIYGEKVKETAYSLLGSTTELINRGCVGQIPEIVDGNTPHTIKGCGAQAWGVTEAYRVLELLSHKP